MNPHWRSPAMAAGSRRWGATTRGVLWAASSVSAVTTCHPSGRSAGTRKLASPMRVPSTSTGSTHQSIWSRSVRYPSSVVTQARTTRPCGTCTHRRVSAPCRTTNTGGSMRRQSRSRRLSAAAAMDSLLDTSSPSAWRTASTVAAPTCTRLPAWSQYCVATPLTSASRASSSETGIHSGASGTFTRPPGVCGPTAAPSRVGRPGSAVSFHASDGPRVALRSASRRSPSAVAD